MWVDGGRTIGLEEEDLFETRLAEGVVAVKLFRIVERIQTDGALREQLQTLQVHRHFGWLFVLPKGTFIKYVRIMRVSMDKNEENEENGQNKMVKNSRINSHRIL